MGLQCLRLVCLHFNQIFIRVSYFIKWLIFIKDHEFWKGVWSYPPDIYLKAITLAKKGSYNLKIWFCPFCPKQGNDIYKRVIYAFYQM